MARKDERGTTDDPAWKGDDLTGGNDSGIAPADMDKGEPVDGPDKTGRITQRERSSVAGTRRPGNEPKTAQRPSPTRSQLEAERQEMADDEPEPGVNEWGP